MVGRFLELKGVGPKIATMAANILVRDFKVPMDDKSAIDVSVDRQVRRVFVRLGLVPEDARNERIVAMAKELNPAYPGVFDVLAWDIGRELCRPVRPRCESCYLGVWCPTAGASVDSAKFDDASVGGSSTEGLADAGGALGAAATSASGDPDDSSVTLAALDARVVDLARRMDAMESFLRELLWRHDDQREP